MIKLIPFAALSMLAFATGCQEPQESVAEASLMSDHDAIVQGIAEGKDQLRKNDSRILQVVLEAPELDPQRATEPLTPKTRNQLATALKGSEAEIEKLAPQLDDKIGGALREIGSEMNRLSTKLASAGEVTNTETNQQLALIFNLISDFRLDAMLAREPINKDLRNTETSIDDVIQYIDQGFKRVGKGVSADQQKMLNKANQLVGDLKQHDKTQAFPSEAHRQTLKDLKQPIDTLHVWIISTF